MAEWSRKKVDSSNINNNKEYAKVDRVPMEQLNAMVNAGLYAQDFAEKLASSVDNSEINNVGTPTVSFESHPDATAEKPYMRFKFSNLKGEKGDKGEQGIQGEAGTSALPLGMILPCSVVTNDARFHLLDGSSLLQSGIYEQFSIWLKERIAESSSNVPTCTIEEYASEMTTYGQCGKFVINDTSSDLASNGYTVYANSIKLPTITEFIASSNGGDTIGLAELDMFKSHNHRVMRYPDQIYQAGYGDGTHTGIIAETASTTFITDIVTNWIGGEETRPKNVRYPYYIVVATSVKTDIEVDIDNVASDINAINGILTKTEQVETIYDMDDSTKDWGYSGGIGTDGSPSLDYSFSKYKKLEISGFRSGLNFTFILNLTTINPNNNRYYGGIDYHVGYEEGTILVYNASAYINSNKDAITFSSQLLRSTFVGTGGASISQIKGYY